MTPPRSKLWIWFENLRLMLAAGYYRATHPPPPPELAKWQAMPFQHEVDHQVSSPIARRILDALRPAPASARVITEGESAEKLATYRGHIRERLRSSDLAARLIDGGGMLPEIADALPEPWAWWARINRPRVLESWARHVRKNLNWYLDPAKTLKPGISWYVGFLTTAGAYACIRQVDTQPALMLALAAVYVAVMLALSLLAGRSHSIDSNGNARNELPRWLFGSLFFGILLGWTNNDQQWFVDPDSSSLLPSLIFGLSMALLSLGSISTLSLIVQDTSAEQVWSRTSWSDASRINAEELYLYLYDQYRDTGPRVAQREPSAHDDVMNALADQDLPGRETDEAIKPGQRGSEL